MENIDDLYGYFQNLTKLFGDEAIRLSRDTWRRRDVLYLANMTIAAGIMYYELFKIRGTQPTKEQHFMNIECALRFEEARSLKKEMGKKQVNLVCESSLNESYNLFKNYFDIFEKKAFELFAFKTKIETKTLADLAATAGQRLLEIIYEKEGRMVTDEYQTVSQKRLEILFLVGSIEEEYSADKIQRNYN